jgi:hypothetical protein
MQIWNDLAKPPGWALKPIRAGRLKGKSDINPQWRYEAMTKQFGICGEGWKYTIDKLWTEQAAHGCVMAFAQITLYVKNGDEWTEGIPGIGGNQMVQVESAGLHSNDECYKMAVTDALSVACKMLGVGADVYKGLSDSKYDNPPSGEPTQSKNGDKEKPWLNEKDKSGKTLDLFKQVEKSVVDGKRTVRQLMKTFKISRAMQDRLKKLEPKSEPDCVPEPEPYNDPGLPF